MILLQVLNKTVIEKSISVTKYNTAADCGSVVF